MTGKRPASGIHIDVWNLPHIHSTAKGTYRIKYPRTRAIKYNLHYHSFLNISTVSSLPGQAQGWEYERKPKDFFRTALSYGNELRVELPTLRKGIAQIDLGNQHYNSTVPDAWSDLSKIGLQLREMRFSKRISAQAGMHYTYQEERFAGRADGLTWLMLPVYTGVSRPETTRLMEENKEKQRTEYLSAWGGASYNYDRLNIRADLSYDRHWDKWERMFRYADSRTPAFRNEDTSDVLLSGNASYRFEQKHNFYYPEIEVNYNFRSTTSRLRKQGTDTSSALTDDRFRRNAQDIGYKFRFGIRHLNVSVANKHYLSTTLRGRLAHHLLPDVYVVVKDIQEWFHMYNNYHYLSLEGSLGYSLAEVPLLYNQLAAFSTLYSVADFHRYALLPDLTAPQGLRPEMYLKHQLQVNYAYNQYRYRLSASLSGFYHHTRNFVLPVADAANATFDLRNAGRTGNYGYQAEATYSYSNYRKTFWEINWKFLRSRNKAVADYTGEPFLRVGGYQEIATVFSKGETVGAIYGTAYARDEYGNLRTDPSGMPVVDTELRKIGDPAPDFIMNLCPHIKYKDFQLSVLFEYSQGGDRWNGTLAYMDTYSRLGTAPAFGSADPLHYSAVAEDYICKATYVRLNELNIQYDIWLTSRRSGPRLTLGASGRNLFVYTPYKGTDPSTLLYGSMLTTGLDLFNQPATRQYVFSLTFEL